MNFLRAIKWLLWVFLPPLLINVAVLWDSAALVLETGQCPPAPPDIPAYPCTLGDFILRMTLGPFAIMGQFLILTAWLIIGLPASLGLWGVIKRKLGKHE
jgi:hypothetical protein